jgi:hypothetical protein
LVSGRLIDVAPVNQPAYKDSTVGLRSLAKFKDAPLPEVIDLAVTGSLGKLFTRSDRPPAKRMSGRQALVELMAKAPGQAPVFGPLAKMQLKLKRASWDTANKPLSGRQALTEILAKRPGPQL